jgi:hypothetical protein
MFSKTQLKKSRTKTGGAVYRFQNINSEKCSYRLLIIASSENFIDSKGILV